MIDTLYATDALSSPKAFFLALLIGLFFGVFLEQAGFGSSKKLSGVFYFKDMAVIKVMFSAVVTAMLGLAYFLAMGWVELDAVYLLPTIYGAQLLGGVIFGVGFVMSGWCPGTAAAGLASGKIDALIALIGAVLGSVLYNEIYPHIKEIASYRDEGVLFVFDSLHLSKPLFILAFALVAVVCFWLCELLENRRGIQPVRVSRSFLGKYSLVLLVFAGGLFLLDRKGEREPGTAPPETVRAAIDVSRETALFEQSLLAAVDEAVDHIEPEELADRMMQGYGDLLVVDVRPAAEYARFHLRGAIN
ncbi:MAG: YeeE/YedE family protein, partial [Planctomycetes bacterium]|nr:YeeE/YedE family protein [Planctomycetota bacterium]